MTAVVAPGTTESQDKKVTFCLGPLLNKYQDGHPPEPDTEYDRRAYRLGLPRRADIIKYSQSPIAQQQIKFLPLGAGCGHHHLHYISHNSSINIDLKLENDKFNNKSILTGSDDHDKCPNYNIKSLNYEDFNSMPLTIENDNYITNYFKYQESDPVNLNSNPDDVVVNIDDMFFKHRMDHFNCIMMEQSNCYALFSTK